MYASTPATYAEIDAAEDELVRLERTIARARARQLEILRWLDSVKITRVHGARSMEEWTAAHLDLAPTTARDLVAAMRGRERGVGGLDTMLDTLSEGGVSFDRAVATAQLATAGAGNDAIDSSLDHDIAGVRRQAARHRRITRIAERKVVRQRHLAITPTLGEAAWQIAGIAPAYDGTLIARALERRADELPVPIEGRDGRSRRLLDALTALAQDYLDAGAPEPARQGSGSGVTVFLDASAPGSGELGAEIAAGPRVGPDAVERILCEGSVSVVTLDGGRPIETSARRRTLPPAVRDAVVQRDGGCVMEGCRSTYRLQPHHVVPWSEGGSHDVDNLASLCWYHHHIAVHGYGKRLDPATPPHRRRFMRRPSRSPP